MEKNPLPSSLYNAIKHIAQLPGYGEKSAQRFIENLLKLPKGESLETIRSLLEAIERIHPCKECGLLTEDEICDICKDEERDKSLICVVEESFDAYAIEKTGKFNGVYHVLQGRLSPLEGITPEQLNIESLLKRAENAKEIIIATNPTVEGEATATYIYNLLKGKNLDISRIAYGLPFGATLENADTFTLSKALEGKRKL